MDFSIVLASLMLVPDEVPGGVQALVWRKLSMLRSVSHGYKASEPSNTFASCKPSSPHREIMDTAVRV